MPEMTRLSSASADFWPTLDRLLAVESVADEALLATVNGIISEVRKRGDAAVREYTQRFDRHPADPLEISPARLGEALAALPEPQRAALSVAAERIRAYAERQRIEPFEYREPDGTLLGQQIAPMDRVGLYVPGGKAAYPSSVLMNAVPAKVAGVPDLIMVVPTPEGQTNQLVLAAAAVAGVDRVFAVGGAQAVAALAFGTESIPAVDKIVGPGNAYVATAKRLVYGVVGIDMIAGPSEILVVCDGQTDPEWIAMDLFSQAEHDEDAQAMLVCPDSDYIEQVAAAMDRLLPTLGRERIVRTSLAARGALIQVRDMDEAVLVANHIAPEHLELSVADAEGMARRIRHAGAIFLGRHTAEVLGDYCAGPNHVLPTSRTARFSSPLGVYDFQKRSSIAGCSPAAARRLGQTAAVLADGEGLGAHAAAARYRVEASE